MTGDEPVAVDRYERLLEVQALLASVAREIGPALELERVLQIVLQAMRSLIDFDGGIVSLLDDHGLYVAAADPEVAADVKPLRLAVEHGISAQAVSTGTTQYSPGIRVGTSLPSGTPPPGSGTRAVSQLAVPLTVFGDVIGAIQVNSGDVAAFDDDDRILLEGLATQVAGSIESARRYEKVAELEVLKSDFIARVSHELRTPITIMSGFVSTLLAHHDDLAPDTRKHMLARVEIAIARLSGLVDELLMLTKLEAGVVAASREAVALRTILDRVRMESTNPDAVTVECDASIVVDTDADLLVRALGFLVDNALKYAGTCELRGTATGIDVIDHGPGIRDDAKTSVFERFTRASDQTTVPGMGIGLPMARTLLAALGADLTLSDAPEGGTQMTVMFCE